MPLFALFGISSRYAVREDYGIAGAGSRSERKLSQTVDVRKHTLHVLRLTQSADAGFSCQPGPSGLRNVPRGQSFQNRALGTGPNYWSVQKRRVNHNHVGSWKGTGAASLTKSWKSKSPTSGLWCAYLMTCGRKRTVKERATLPPETHAARPRRVRRRHLRCPAQGGASRAHPAAELLVWQPPAQRCILTPLSRGCLVALDSHPSKVPLGRDRVRQRFRRNGVKQLCLESPLRRERVGSGS